ncbi:MAG: SGNH/GDSL hydrolase family protein [Verrucomicrobia bacterium]|nr:SGNH/GDSL hydrolase family protein [Verrucomicrobiota bacterium]
MKSTTLGLLLALSLGVFGAESPLTECSPRAGLPNFFAKLGRGDAVRIAYLGGSITAQDGWRPKTLKWFQQEFPKATVSEINAAIGGTGSDLGVFRLRHDVLDHKPDLLFVEFAVNDGGASPEQIHRGMEGIVRQTWRENPATDICYVYTIAGNMLDTLKEGKLPRSYAAMEKLAAHYGIPSINMGLEVARLEKAGKLVFKGAKPKTDAEKAVLGDKILFSPDAVHPFADSGHQLYLDAIVRSLGPIQRAGKAAADQPSPHALIKPLVADNWEQAKMIPLSRARLSGGWTQLDAETNNLAKSFGKRLPEVWKASQPGDTIEFKFKGTSAGIYDLVGPDCGQVIVRLDDKPAALRPRFDAYCTYHRLATLMVGSNLTNSLHTVKLEIHPDQPDKAKILAQRQETMDNPKRFEGRAWYAGALMLIGDLVGD